MSEIKIFISYSHIDEQENHCITELKKFLDNFISQNQISLWDDKKLLPGDYWDKKIICNLEESDIYIMFISQNYLASDSCKQEINIIQKEIQKSKKKTAIPIILRQCTWKDHNFLKKLQALPLDAKPISNWSDPSEAYKNIFEQFKELLYEKYLLKVKDNFLKECENTEFSINDKRINLSEIFIWPKLINFTPNKDNKYISSSTELVYKYGKIIICGDAQAGKSSLLKKMYIDLKKQNKYPLLIDGNKAKNSSKMNNILKEFFNNQYYGSFENMCICDDIIIIIDDYNHSINNTFMSELMNKFKNIIIGISKQEYMLYYRDSDITNNFKVFDILTCNKKQIYSLVRNWQSILAKENKDISEFQIDYKSVDITIHKINDIIVERNILPSYPFYILTILQSLEKFTPINYEITSYGTCYLILIYSNLYKKGIDPKVVDDACMNFLSYIAYGIYKSNILHHNNISHNNYTKLKEAYKKEYIISDSIINLIENTEYPILKITNDTVKFEFLYIYYFLVGRYIAKKSLYEEVELLCKDMHRSNFANILIFIIHHTDSQKILDDILIYTMVILDEYTPASLVKDETSFLNKLISQSKDIINNKSVEKNRTDSLNIVDENEQTYEYSEEIHSGYSDAMEPIEKALKNMKIIGQIIKNKSGSFTKDQLQNMMENIETLGFRLLTFFLNTLKENDFKTWLSNKIYTDKKNITMEQKKQMIEIEIQSIGFLIILWIINDIYKNITTQDVIQIQKEISNKYELPSYEFITLLFHIFYEDLDTDYIKKLYDKYKKDNNFWAYRTLSLIMQSYMNYYHIDYKKAQQLCQALNISLNKTRFLRNEIKK